MLKCSDGPLTIVDLHDLLKYKIAMVGNDLKLEVKLWLSEGYLPF